VSGEKPSRKLIVSRKAAMDMVLETLRYPNLETMWVNFGFLLPDRSIYLAGIIPPLEGCIKRSYAGATLGGERLGIAFEWLKYEASRLNADQSVRFVALYKGHSHDQLLLSSYSWTDDTSLVEFVKDNDGIDVGVGPLTTVHRGQGYADVKVTFYLYTREMLEKGESRPRALSPGEVSLVSEVPGVAVPRLAWQFAEEHEYNAELGRLRTGGYEVMVCDSSPPTTKWLIKRSSWRGGIAVIDFPLGFPDEPFVMGALPAGGSFVEMSPPAGTDIASVLQSLEREMAGDASS
jgi:hypothetical protein